MATHKYVVALGADSSLARDYMVNTLYFHHLDSGGVLNVDLGAMADTVCGAYQAMITGAATATREIRCKVYDVTAAAEHPPLAEAVRNAGAFPASQYMREIAVCLSFKADGTPARRRRGRIYVPLTVALSGTVSMGIRPPAAVRDRLIALADAFAAAGGADVSWRVRSQADQDDYQVVRSWVDDEYDVQRRRGFRPTTRTEKATGS
jgi:hypothetical protein